MLIAVLILLSILSACGKEEASADKSKKEPAATEKQDDSINKELSDSMKNYPQFTNVQENEKEVLMKTSKGDIRIKLFPEYAPKAVENFITHAENGYYDGLKFHRVINDFMIQGGDPEGSGMGGESIWGKPFEDEFSMKLFNFRGALSMANSGANTNGSQFFIVQAKSVDPEMKDQMLQAGFPEEVVDAYMKIGGTPHLDHKHTVFGHVIDGMDVVDEIAGAKTKTGDMPEKDIVVKEVEVIK